MGVVVMFDVIGEGVMPATYMMYSPPRVGEKVVIDDREPMEVVDVKYSVHSSRPDKQVPITVTLYLT